MAEDVRIFGADTHVPKRTFPWLLGGAAVVAFLALRSKSASPSSSASTTQDLSALQSANNQSSLEFFQAQQQAQYELAQLTAANKLEIQAQQNTYNQTGAGQRMCIPLSTWYNLAPSDRAQFSQRVNNGQLLETLGPDGICFTPTAAGSAGYMPYTRTSSKQGLFGGSYSTVGPANAGASYAPMAPPPSIFGFLESIFRAFNQPIGYVPF